MLHPFVHLHVHSEYSQLDGIASVKGLVDKAIADGMPGIALTDHGNMFGIKELANYVGKKRKEHPDFKAIYGCEMYVAEKNLHEMVDKHDRGRHLIVLAKNKTGYKNLIKLVSKAWTEGFYAHPRTDRDELAAHSEGLIVASACLGGELPRLIMAGREQDALERARWYKSVFGDDYYIELQRHKPHRPEIHTDTYERQQMVNPVLIRIARELDIKLIATNDTHFINEEDADAHERMVCLSTNTLLSDPNRRLAYTKEEWLKSQQEMNDIWADIPEALDNTIEILNKVEVYSIDHAPIMPTFAIPEEFGTEEQLRQAITEQQLFDEFTRDENGQVVLSEEKAREKIEKLGGYDKLYRIKLEADYLKKLAYEGAERRYGSPLSQELQDRIRFELHIMKTMGFPGYFLIVQDFINAAREKLGVWVGPGRGSAAGSVVAYCLGITQIDPVKYDLLFERFLNPDRISLPDIDIDFDDDGRADVLRYVTEKYGESKVAHIVTYGTLAAKSAIKDVGRIEQLSLPETDRLSKLVPRRMPTVNGKELKPTLKNCYEYVPEFKAELQSPNPLVVETLKYAEQLEGTVRNCGVHACGVIICRDDITDWVPVSTAEDKSSGTKEKIIVTQYEGRVIEETGLIKMDFLGLRTLSILKEAVANIKRTRGFDLDIDNVPIDDPKTYQLYCEGRTTGTFQFESAGMQKYLRELQPSTFEDLIAMNALYRPGPMDYIPDFIARKHGQSPIVYDIPIMEQYLKDTYGVTVYQEQVMLLSRLLAGFTRGQSDTLRKAMGKKMIEKMNELKDLFLKGGEANGHDPKTLEKIWADWEKFASYAFNKSHATCYSWVAFQTAYLKANYPAEYMAAVLSCNLSDITKLTNFMNECRKMRIPIKGPDINESYTAFSVNSKGDIRFGLAAIKGIGENVVADIVSEREKGGPFQSVYDFVERVNLSSVNRRIMENLAAAGAFDCFSDLQREDFFEKTPKGDTFTEQLLRYGQMYQADKQQAGMSLFGEDDASLTLAGRPAIVHGMRWIDAERLERERELVGIYISAHPLDPYYMELRYGMAQIKDIEELEPIEGQEYIYGGLVMNTNVRTVSTGARVADVTLEDFSGTTRFALFDKVYYSYGNYCQPNTPVYIKGTYGRGRDGTMRFRVASVGLLSDLKGQLLHGLTITLDKSQLTEAVHGVLLENLKEGGGGGDTTGSLSIRVFEPSVNRYVRFNSSLRVPMTRDFIDTLESLELDFHVA